MTTSNDSAARLSAYLDSELDPNELAEVEEFLDSSPDARKEIEELRELLSVVSKLDDVEAPPDFYDKLSRNLRKPKNLSEGLASSLVSAPFQVASIVVILVVAALYMMVQLEADTARIEKDEKAASADVDVDE